MSEPIRIANPLEQGAAYTLHRDADDLRIVDAAGAEIARESRAQFGRGILLGIGWQQVLVLRTAGKRVLKIDAATARAVLAWYGARDWIAQDLHVSARLALVVGVGFGALALLDAFVSHVPPAPPAAPRLTAALWPMCGVVAGLVGVLRPAPAFHLLAALTWCALTAHAAVSALHHGWWWWLLAAFALGMALLAQAKWRFLRTA